MIKFPKINHLPFSLHITDDDRVLPDTHIFEGKEVVVTLKMDGENSGISQERTHARSLDSRDHVSRHCSMWKITPASAKINQ